ncbi:hypothetical protein GE061_002297 [Apolygus lucorum]|uniref:DUF4550 domain-containing protein n=1 Tax=Apolygus lucorum TaxID=248454 RepID=A0A6A4JAW0_APOLU|nr:hypothetical protein GE061_002297 [Apolygus lucorum]
MSKIRGSSVRRSFRLSSPGRRRATADNGIITERDGVTYYHPSSRNLKYCHIFYLLAPTQMINISVAVRGEVAKVCTKDEVVAMKIVRVDPNTRWVAFSIEHQIKGPGNSQEVVNWNQHKIEFNISENLANIFPRATKDDVYCIRTNSITFFEPQETVQFEKVGLASEMLRAEDDETGTETQTSTKKAKSKEQNVSKLQAVPSPAHIDSIKAKIFDAVPLPQRGKESIRTNESTNEEVGEEVPKKKRKKKKNKTKTLKSSDKKPMMTITGTKLLYDQRTWTDSHLHATKHVQIVNTWVTSTNFISEEIRNELIPFGIHIRKLVNFPNVNKVSSKDKVFIKYSLGDLIKNIAISPKEMDNSESITEIDDVKIFFLGTVPLLKIIENLQMHKLVIEIYGSKQEEQAETKELCSWEELDRIGKRAIVNPPVVDVLQKTKKEMKTKKKTKEQKTASRPKKKKRAKSAPPETPDLSRLHLLGYAEVNCSSLAADGFRMDIDTNITQYNSSENVIGKYAIKHFDLFNIHENENEEHNGVIENGLFVANQSQLKVNLRISGLPGTTSVERKELFVNLCKRIIIIFREKTIMVMILKRILKMNAKVMGYKYIDVPWMPYWFPRKINSENDGFSALEHPCILSGFTIGFDDLSIMMVEGLNDYTFPEAMKDVFFLPTSYGRVLYDDQLIFTQRLYQDFFPIGGFYITESKTSIDDIMYNRKTYLRGNIPIPAKRALFKIYQMLHCKTIQVVSMEKLFPQPQDLMSFNIEFGSPPIK